MTRTNNEKVREFYEKFDQSHHIPAIGEQATLKNMDPARVTLKLSLILEEFTELVEAVYNKKAADLIKETWDNIHDYRLDEPRNLDVVEAADATGDLRYVIEGLDIEAGIPSDEVFTEIHESNMSKLGEDGRPVLSEVKPVGKILKGKNFFDPDLAGVIAGREPDRTPRALKAKI